MKSSFIVGGTVEEAVDEEGVVAAWCRGGRAAMARRRQARRIGVGDGVVVVEAEVLLGWYTSSTQ